MKHKAFASFSHATLACARPILHEYHDESVEYLQWIVRGFGAPDGGYPEAILAVATEVLVDVDLG